MNPEETFPQFAVPTTRAHFLKLARVAVKLARAWKLGTQNRDKFTPEMRTQRIASHLGYAVQYRAKARAYSSLNVASA